MNMLKKVILLILINGSYIFGLTPQEMLFQSVVFGYAKGIEQALKKGANIKVCTRKESNSYLHLAVLCNQIASVNELLKHGADPDGINKNGYTPLHFAAHEINYSHPSVILLLRYGANPNMQNEKGETPLHISALMSHPSSLNVFEELLKHPDINIELKDYLGRTPIHIAVINHQYDKIGLLRKRGAAIDVEDSAGFTPREIAREKPYDLDRKSIEVLA